MDTKNFLGMKFFGRMMYFFDGEHKSCGPVVKVSFENGYIVFSLNWLARKYAEIWSFIEFNTLVKIKVDDFACEELDNGLLEFQTDLGLATIYPLNVMVVVPSQVNCFPQIV